MSSGDLAAGMWVLDQYRVARALGNDGILQVYLADQPTMERQVLIKVLPTAQIQEEANRTKFRIQSRALSRLSHPHIAAVYNYGELEDGAPFLALEYPEGTPLMALLHEGPSPVLRALTLVYQCAAGLAFAHARKAVYRHFRPGKVVIYRLMGRDHVKVFDFGVCRLLNCGPPQAHSGESNYVSPERVRGERPSAASDQYTLGLVLYRLVTGKRVPRAEKSDDNIPLPSSLCSDPGLVALDPIVLRMLDPDPEKRYPSLDELLQVLDRTAERILVGQTRKRLAPGLVEAGSDEFDQGSMLTPTGTHDDLVGTWVLGQYRITKQIGQGGMGRVYLAEQPSMERLAVVKLLPSSELPREEMRARFRREAKVASRLSHPNIVTVYNSGELPDGSLFLAMEYVRGVCLRKLIKSGPLPLLRAINLAHQCAGALGHAHNMQVIHRDFTPDNVMLSKLLGRDHVKVLDLGIAFLTGDESLTQPGDILGTAEYLSPEQARGEDVTGLSDEYALGLVLYYMLTGQAAVESDTFLGYLHLHQNVMPDPPSSLRQEPGVELLDPIVLRMVAKRAEERFPNMAEVQKELERVLELLLLRNKAKKRT